MGISPAELPTDPKSNAIVFLDELNSAAPAVQAAAYQLILNRRVGQYHLPEGVSIVAAGNRESDKGVTYRMPAPLANRFVHVELRVDFEDWLQWATNQHIHADVVGYCTFAKQDLYDFDPRGSSSDHLQLQDHGVSYHNFYQMTCQKVRSLTSLQVA